MEFEKTARTQIVRDPARGKYDRDTVYAIIDAAPICQVAFVEGDQPFVLPMIHAREGDELIFHGSRDSRLIAQLSGSRPLCISFTLLDGLVVARAPSHSSMNYRSAIVFGRGRRIEDPAMKLAALKAVVEKLFPGRWADSRQPTEAELASTSVLRVAIESVSAKMRSGPPTDDEQDLALPIWAGVLPIERAFGKPERDPRSGREVDLPPYLANLKLYG